MKQGITTENGQPDLATLLRTVQQTKDAAQDYVGSTEMLYMRPTGEIEIDTGAGAGPETGAITSELVPSFDTTTHSRRQITDWAKVPAAYADRCPSELLAINVNHWFRNGVDGKGPAARMLRTLQPCELLGITEPKLRAFVSDRYRRIDNWDFVNAIFPVLQEYAEKSNLIIESVNVDEHTLNVKGRIDGVEEQIMNPKHRLGEGHNEYHIVKPGFEMRNGETGRSVVSFAPALYDSRCTNLAVFRENAQRRYHLGRSQAEGELWGLLTDETQAQSNRALMMQLADYCRASLDSSGQVFQQTCNMLREKLGIEVKRPEATMKLVADQFGLSETETSDCVAALLERGDMSVFGIQAAVTQVSQADEISYERATELEALGGDILAWPAQNWDKLLTQAADLKVKVAA